MTARKRSTKPARPDWIDDLLAGDRRALARAITAVENETPDAAAVLAAVYSRLGGALVVGVTGPPGAGKSTLLGRFIDALRRREQTVGVIAVDPSSPISGGALLGDRLRMTRAAPDPAVFIRSLATRGHLGGLSRTAMRVADVMDAAGKDVVLIETVGVGQSEVEIADIADISIFVTAPGLGDTIQALKAGILEIADLIVVNKADLAGADTALSAFESVQAATKGAPGTVLATVATVGTGIDALAERVAALADARAADRASRPRNRVRRLIAALAADRLRDNLRRQSDRQLDAICDAVLRGELTFDQAAARALALAGRRKDKGR